MDGRVATFLFLLVLVIQGKPSCSEDCLVLRIPDFACPYVFPLCKVTCGMRAIGHHGKGVYLDIRILDNSSI
uniref:Uncharacterized protein n=1 Tax=Oryza barthii TaxID=65489 RepID=A0A0D3HCG6_9ORYZ